MTLSSALIYGRKALEGAEIADAQVDAWQLLEYVCGCDRSYYCHRNRNIGIVYILE